MLPVGSHVLRRGLPGGVRAVLVHGLEDSWRSWRPVAEALPGSWQVRAAELPWQTGTDYRWRGRGGPAQWLAAALPELPDVLVAHSFAATAALEVMASAGLPDVDVVLVCPLYAVDGPVTWRTLEQARATFETHVRDGIVARLRGRAATMEVDILDAMTAFALERVGATGLLTMFDRYTASAVVPLAEITQRVAVVAGRRDRSLPVAAARDLAARLPGGELLLEPDLDHFCHLLSPERVAHHVRAFHTRGLASSGSAREA